MSPKARRERILDYLINTKDWVTVSSISDMFSVSERTVHNDLKIIEKILINRSCKLLKKPGVGIRVDQVKNNEESLSERINENDLTRKLKILVDLLIQNKVVTIEELADQFYVSPSSIQSDMAEIRSELSNSTLVSLVSDKQGTYILGNEEEIQQAICWLNKQLLHYFSGMNKNDKIQKQVLNLFYPDSMIEEVYKVLYNYIKMNNNLISEYYTFNVLNVFLVLVYRISSGFHHKEVSDSGINFTSNSFLEYRTIANFLLRTMFSQNNKVYDERDITYFAKYLMLNRFYIGDKSGQSNKLVDKLISQLSDSLGINFSKDHKLERLLENHIPPMIYRLKSGQKINNPFVEKIKAEYGPTFYTIWHVVSHYEDELDVKFNEEEVGLLAIYFQSAMERTKSGSKILIVCQYGIATAELLLNRLQSILSPNDETLTASLSEYKNMDLSKFDIIISTTESIEGPNVIHSSPFIEDDQLLEIKENYLQKNSENRGFPHIYKFINKDYIFLNTKIESKPELIDFVCTQLESNGYVDSKYASTVVQRERLGNTDMPSGYALPHGNAQHVKKSVICFFNSDKKFHWTDYGVDKIFMLVLTTEDLKESKNIIKEIYRIMKFPEIASRFYQNIYNLMGGKE
ncbi:BglG family transcription antiterminator [Hutsoniella sourekii]|uniref:BglG family transcription antiterminator n=1 Tax=Hutsoniella sourekii TaxID=87650 RepID=UPI00048035B7|nr:BglG family transcription antiterminator [Hutsoniella sourekii]